MRLLTPSTSSLKLLGGLCSNWTVTKLLTAVRAKSRQDSRPTVLEPSTRAAVASKGTSTFICRHSALLSQDKHSGGMIHKLLAIHYTRRERLWSRRGWGWEGGTQPKVEAADQLHVTMLGIKKVCKIIQTSDALIADVIRVMTTLLHH